MRLLFAIDLVFLDHISGRKIEMQNGSRTADGGVFRFARATNPEPAARIRFHTEHLPETVFARLLEIFCLTVGAYFDDLPFIETAEIKSFLARVVGNSFRNEIRFRNRKRDFAAMDGRIFSPDFFEQALELRFA